MMLQSLLPIPTDETGLAKDSTPSMGIGGNVLESYFLTCIYWSLGATLIEESRVKFDDVVKRLANLPQNAGEGSVVELGEIPVHLETLYEYYLDTEQNKWVPWKDKVPEYVHDPDRKFTEILVPTVDTVRTTWLIELMINVRRPCLLVGESGTSKTATIQNYLRGLDPDVNVRLYMSSVYNTYIHVCICMSSSSYIRRYVCTLPSYVLVYFTHFTYICTYVCLHTYVDLYIHVYTYSTYSMLVVVVQ